MTTTATYTLIVEDDADTCNWLRRLLDKNGCSSECVQTVAEARHKLDAELPAGIILDLHLPDGSGVEIMRKVRDENLPVKVALLSGNRAKLSEAILLRPDAVFLKPVEACELLSWLDSIRHPL